MSANTERPDVLPMPVIQAGEPVDYWDLVEQLSRARGAPYIVVENYLHELADQGELVITRTARSDGRHPSRLSVRPGPNWGRLAGRVLDDERRSGDDL
jgi:hypothetical protein